VRQEYRKAREMYSRTVELEPPFLDEALFNLALVEARLGKHEESTKNLERALKFNPDNKQVKSYLERLDT
jgi:tetratricopeptide (TPR) repeat protein